MSPSKPGKMKTLVNDNNEWSCMQCRINLCGNCGMATGSRAFVDHIFKISCAPFRVPAMSTTIRAASSV